MTGNVKINFDVFLQLDIMESGEMEDPLVPVSAGIIWKGYISGGSNKVVCNHFFIY